MPSEKQEENAGGADGDTALVVVAVEAALTDLRRRCKFTPNPTQIPSARVRGGIWVDLWHAAHPAPADPDGESPA